MKSKHTSILIKSWIYTVLEKIAKERDVSVAVVINQMLARELNLMGYTEADYVLGEIKKDPTQH